MARKRELSIKGKGELAHVDVDITFDTETGELVEIKNKNTGGGVVENPPGQEDNPECTLNNIILESLVDFNPTWVKINGKWYRIG